MRPTLALVPSRNVTGVTRSCFVSNAGAVAGWLTDLTLSCAASPACRIGSGTAVAANDLRSTDWRTDTTSTTSDEGTVDHAMGCNCARGRARMHDNDLRHAHRHGALRSAPRLRGRGGSAARTQSRVGSITPDGAVTLDLRNYSPEPFVFAGAPDRPQLIIEVQLGNTHSRHTISPWSARQKYEVPAGERIQLKASVAGLSGRVRIGIRSHQFGYIVWTDWIAP